jgi:glyoxylase-like metal-dependent hydrolase (beta-lactamase superfamily II)
MRAGLRLLGCLILAFAPAPGVLTAQALQPAWVAPGIYAFMGFQEEIAPANCGNVSNSGFLIGSEGVIAIDTGPHAAHGERILQAISRVTSKPVVLAINTHSHPENVLGNSAFARRGIPILAHGETIRAMRERCAICLENMRRQLGEIIADTEVVIPQRSVASSTEIEAGGRRLKLLYFGWAHAEGDLAVLDLETGVLFSGGLVYVDRIPVLAQGKIRGWIAALEQLAREPIRKIVPGHGPVSSLERIADTLGYLKPLLSALERQYRDGKGALDVLRTSELPAYRDWALYEPTHNLNIQHVYRELEKEELEK